MNTKNSAQQLFRTFIGVSIVLLLPQVEANPIFITPDAPKINAATYIIMDHNSGEVLAASNPDTQHKPASLVKMMTAYVVFQLLRDGRISLDDDVIISEQAWRTGGSKSFVELGKNVKLEVLLKGMIIQSGNDAAVALAEHIAGTEGTFATYMNEYAKELEMNNSRFENASGLPHPEQYTTARDMALLASATIRDFPEYYPWYKERQFEHHGIKQYNRNRLLWTDQTIDGLKTGYTQEAGYNLVASAERVGMRLVSSVMGSSSEKARNNQTQKILDYGFRFFQTVTLNEVEKEVPVFKSNSNSIRVGIGNNAFLTLPRGQFKVAEQTLKIERKMIAPIAKGEVVGEFLLTLEGQTIKTLPLVALEPAKQGGIVKRVVDSIKMLF